MAEDQTEPPDGLTRRTRRLLAWTAVGTGVGSATVGAALNFASDLSQAIGAFVFGVGGALVMAPSIIKDLRETRATKDD